MIHLKNPQTNQILSFESWACIGAGFADWPEASPSEVANSEVQKAKENKISELEAFHDSDSVKVITIVRNGQSHKLPVYSSDRNLIKEQIGVMEGKVRLAELQNQSLDISTLVWNYKLPENGFVPLTYQALLYIYTHILDQITNPNFVALSNHKAAINNLESLEEIENYDFTTGYLLNQTLTLA